ncbi:right-handed parallel beta-helix repeat-containing protein [Patescibacteria group bacterium]
MIDIKKIIYIFFGIVCLHVTSSSVNATTYYVATNGSDSNVGTQSQPLATFDKANQVIQAGDTLYIKDGTYNQILEITKSGTSTNPITIQAENTHQAVVKSTSSWEDSTVLISGNYVVIKGVDVAGSDGYCIEVNGDNVTIQSNKAHECDAHGIYTNAGNTFIKNNSVYRATLMNESKNRSSGWGSGIKVKYGATNTTITNNLVYENYGEGIAVTRGIGAIVAENSLYDNYAGNIYIDNSKDVVVERNFSYNTGNSEFFRDGEPASGLAMEEEDYDDWDGAQHQTILENITFRNNIVAFTGKGIYYYDSGLSGTGLDTVKIINNTFWDTTGNTISIETPSAKTRNSVIANNIIYQPDGDVGYVEDRNGVDVYNNHWVGTNPDSWRNFDGTGDIYDTNPQFSGTPGTNSVDYRLTSSSPDINAGGDVAGVSEDFEGKSRDSSPDIGAMEYAILLTSTPTPTVPSTITPTPTQSACNAADINQNGIVDISDYSLLIIDLLKTSPSNPRADINKDGIVDISDYSLLIQQFLKTC